MGRPRATTDLPWDPSDYGGWGGHRHFRTHPGTTGNPVVFVHGSTRDASDWDLHATELLNDGWRGDDLWAISFAETMPTHDQMAAQLDDFVRHVKRLIGEPVDVVAHSLGVTGVRYWLRNYDRYDWVETMIGLAGPNHGTSASWLHPFQYMMVESPVHAVMRTPGIGPSPFLQRLNADETPGDIDYYTIRGASDVLFLDCPESPMLQGAEENVELSCGHHGARNSSTAREYIRRWLER